MRLPAPGGDQSKPVSKPRAKTTTARRNRLATDRSLGQLPKSKHPGRGCRIFRRNSPQARGTDRGIRDFPEAEYQGTAATDAATTGEICPRRTARPRRETAPPRKQERPKKENLPDKGIRTAMVASGDRFFAPLRLREARRMRVSAFRARPSPFPRRWEGRRQK